MKNKLYLTIAIIAFFSAACDDQNWMNDSEHNRRVTGVGRVESREIFVDDFTEIDLENVSNVYVAVGQEQSVTFTAYSNILSYMDGWVVGNELVLKFNKDINVNSDKEIRVDITVPELNKVKLSGVGNFYLGGPVQHDLSVELNGVGNIYAADLPVYNAVIDINGNGNVEVVAKETLNVDIDGLGNVYYTGNPSIDTDIKGLGEVVQKAE